MRQQKENKGQHLLMALINVNKVNVMAAKERRKNLLNKIVTDFRDSGRKTLEGGTSNNQSVACPVSNALKGRRKKTVHQPIGDFWASVNLAAVEPLVN